MTEEKVKVVTAVWGTSYFALGRFEEYVLVGWILFPKQQQRPLPFLLYLSFFYDCTLYTVQYTLVCLFVYIYLANKPDIQLFIHSQLRQARFLEIQIIFETGRYWKAMGIRVKCVSFFTCVFFFKFESCCCLDCTLCFVVSTPGPPVTSAHFLHTLKINTFRTL